MAKSYQTLVASGLVYEEALPNPAQQAIISTIRKFCRSFANWSNSIWDTTLRDTEIFHALVFALRLAHVHTSGRPLSRGFIDFLHNRFPTRR